MSPPPSLPPSSSPLQLLNCIMDMVEKTRRSLTVLRRCQEADREEMNHWIRRYSDVEDMKKGGSNGQPRPPPPPLPPHNSSSNTPNNVETQQPIGTSTAADTSTTRPPACRLSLLSLHCHSVTHSVCSVCSEERGEHAGIAWPQRHWAGG